MPAPRTEAPASASANLATGGSSTAPALDAQAIERRVRGAQVGLVFSRTRVSNLAAPLVAALVAWLLWDLVEHAWLIAWSGSMTAFMAWREAIYRRFMADGPENALKWGRRYEIVLVAHGLAYGLIGTLLLPRHNAAVAAVMLATLVGAAAVSLVALSASLRATVAFILPELLPAIVWQLAEGGRLQTFAGVAMTVFLVLIAFEGRKASEHALEMLGLRFRMDHLASQRKQALDQAQRSSAVKGQFLATMSHEMRTPLHGILGVTRLLHSSGAGDDPQTRRHRLGMIERTGEHLLALINDVLDYSKIEGGHLALDPSDFDLTTLVESVADLARVSASEKGLILTLDLATPSPCWVRADAARLRQVLLNLTGNAVKFTEHGGVTLKVRRQTEGSTRVEVFDTGPGVAADQREAIFDAFHQADGSFGRRHGGTGLGLTISRELARRMGGDLSCVGQAETGKTFETGARFVLSLPLPEAMAPPPAREAKAAPATFRGRVLVAEDNPVNALVVEALLRNAGLLVDPVADGAHAVASAAATSYDLILMDCQMPGIDGFEATRQIRARERGAGSKAVPIVALTANALAADRERSLACGMTDHMAKPFSDDDLRALLKRHLG